MKDEPAICQVLFGPVSQSMPPVFQAHYANRIDCSDIVKVSGKMEIWQHPLMRPFGFLLRWTKTLVPVSEEAVDTEVFFRTKTGSEAFWYDRRFTLGNGKQMQFMSRMEPRANGEVIEWTGAGIGWHCQFSYDGSRVHLKHLGYRLRVGRFETTLPTTWLLGTPEAWEEALSDTEFRMRMSIDHPVFGQIYAYAGDFRIEDIILEE